MARSAAALSGSRPRPLPPPWHAGPAGVPWDPCKAKRTGLGGGSGAVELDLGMDGGRDDLAGFKLRVVRARDGCLVVEHDYRVASLGDGVDDARRLEDAVRYLFEERVLCLG